MPLYPATPAADQPTVQARRTTAFTLGAAFADISLDATDVENYAPVIEQTAADQITVKLTGNYEVSYGCTGPAFASTVALRVRKNDATVLVGSEASATSAGDALDISRQFVVGLTANDYITIQATSDAGAPDIAAGLTLTITHLAGQKGDTGAASATDVNAVHVNVGNEINIIANKPAPSANDALIIEDSLAGYVKKRLLVGNLPGGASLSDLDPSDVDGAAADPGVGAEASRYDHKHDVSVAQPPAGAVVVGNAASLGAGPELSLHDHQHAVVRGNPVSVGTALVAGATGQFADAGHVHTGLTRGANDFSVFSAKASPAGADLLLIEDSAGAGAKKYITISNLPGGVDTTAIHKATAGEISVMTDKPVPAAADVLVIEDSATGFDKKRLSVGNLPGDTTAVHKAVAGEFSAMVNKATPVLADLLVIEDSVGGFAKANVLVGDLPVVVAGVSAGYMTAAMATQLSTAADEGITLTAGTGMTGGGDLSANRTFNVVANADGSIVANAGDIQVGVLATDAQHGVRGGGTQHAAVVAGVSNGFMTAAMATTLAAAVPNTRTITAGTGLTGGGDLTANRTINVAANADGSILSNADDIQVGILATDAQHGVRGGGTQHAAATGAANGFMVAADFTKLASIAKYYIAEEATPRTRNANSDQLMGNQTLTPAAGTYLVTFSGSVGSSTNARTVTLSIYAAGLIVSASQREYAGGNDADVNTFCCQAVVTVNGAQTIEGQWRTTTPNTATSNFHTLTALRVQ